MAYKSGFIGKLCAGLALIGFFVLAAASLPHVVGASGVSTLPENHPFVYVGTYTDAKSKGIYSYRFDAKTGHLTPMGLAAEVVNPSFLATDPQHRFLYAVTERGEGPVVRGSKANGYVSSFSINPKTGALKFLNKVSTGGSVPGHLGVDRTGKMLFVANYGSGSVVSFAIKDDGSIGDSEGFDQHHGSSINPHRQEGPHPHAVVFSPDNRFLFVPDLGTDRIMIYRVDAVKGAFAPNNPAFVSVRAGLGPRHLVFGPGAKFAYVVCEMGSSVVVFSYDHLKGSLTPVQTISTLPSDFKGEDNSAEIQVGRSGRFLYASNRENGSITVFAVNPQNGTLTQVQLAPTQGMIPRSFAIDPTGKYLVAANQQSDRMVVFAVDRKTGRLTPNGQVLSISSPVCVLFVPEA